MVLGAIKARGELISPTQNVNLTVAFRDQLGNLIDTDSFPTISIVQPSGSVLFPPTSAGVVRTSVGMYSYLFQIPYNGPYGIFNDIWTGIINGFTVQATFSFAVSYTDQPSAPNNDGYFALGDSVGFDYSQTAIFNINKLLKMLKARLNSSGKSKKIDSSGNVQYVDCDIFSIDMLVTFLAMSLSKFNSTPYFTYYTFDDNSFIAQFGEVLVEGATLFAMASQALLERGREFTITDSGIGFNPPTVSELLNTEYSTTLTHYWEQLKYIKNSIRPAPIGLGIYNMMGAGTNPAIKRLRHMRDRRIL